jgi:pyridoxine/pyridoxamine 5'-phosphate oxidase
MPSIDICTFTATTPVEQFGSWFDEAKKNVSDVFDPNSMTIATASK